VDGRRTGAAGFSLLIDHALTDVSVVMRGDTYLVDVGGRVHRVQLLDARRARAAAAPGAGEREVRAAMPGKIVAVLVEVGATVTRGQGLLVIEAMKMENEVTAPRDGTVQDIRVQSGQTEKQAGDYAEDLAASMLATILGVDFDPNTSYDERKDIWRMSDKIVITRQVTQSAIGDRDGLWTSVVAAAVFAE